MKRYGLVLSGGAAYGLANAGLLEVLEREGLRPDCIAGSSMGAIVAAVYALSGSAKMLPDLSEKIRLTNVARLSPTFLRGGLHGGMLQQRLAEHLSRLLGEATIGDCRIPFVCVAAKVHEPITWTKILRTGFTDDLLRHVSLHVFPKETRLLDAVMASSAIPVLFSPVVIGSETFVDLVHFGAIPARTLKKAYQPEVIIATDTNPRYSRLKKLLPKPWYEFLERGYEELERSRTACDLVIRPVMPAALWRFDKAAAFLAAGKSAAEEAMPEMRKLLERIS